MGKIGKLGPEKLENWKVGKLAFCPRKSVYCRYLPVKIGKCRRMGGIAYIYIYVYMVTRSAAPPPPPPNGLGIRPPSGVDWESSSLLPSLWCGVWWVGIPLFGGVEFVLGSLGEVESVVLPKWGLLVLVKLL